MSKPTPEEIRSIRFQIITGMMDEDPLLRKQLEFYLVIKLISFGDAIVQLLELPN